MGSSLSCAGLCTAYERAVAAHPAAGTRRSQSLWTPDSGLHILTFILRVIKHGLLENSGRFFSNPRWRDEGIFFSSICLPRDAAANSLKIPLPFLVRIQSVTGAARYTPPGITISNRAPFPGSPFSVMVIPVMERISRER